MKRIWLYTRRFAINRLRARTFERRPSVHFCVTAMCVFTDHTARFCFVNICIKTTLGLKRIESSNWAVPITSICSCYVRFQFPDITGTIDITDAYFSSATGAFQQGGVTTRGTGANIVADNRYSVFLDSSRINSIYSGNKLQPKALQALIIIKT